MSANDNDVPVPTPRDARRVLVLSTISFTLLFAVWLMFGVLGVPIKKELGLTQVQFSWLAAVAVLSGSLGRLPFGMLTDRVGGRALMAALLVTTAIPCALVSHAHSYGALIALAFWLGGAGNSFSVGIAWNAAWSTPARQGFALGTFGAGNVGASVTKLIGPALIALVPTSGFLDGLVPGGWRFVPTLYASTLLVCAVALLALTPARDRKPGSARSFASMLAPLANARVWRFGLYYVLVFGAYVAFSLWMPTYYQTVYHLPLSRAALLTAAFIFPASLLRPVGGWLSDRLGARVVTTSVFVTMMLACVPLCLPAVGAGGPIGLGACFTLLEIVGVAMGIGKASVYKYVSAYFPGDVGAVGGLVGSLGALGGFFLPIGFAYLDRVTGRHESCFWLLLAFAGVSFAWLTAVVLRLKRGERPAANGELARAA
ncbi:MAG TPA: nitrate/nitrite transporter [Polyangia bacterium]|nr:nitrate/nitrite transporter [Polyangia bacterium]